MLQDAAEGLPMLPKHEYIDLLKQQGYTDYVTATFAHPKSAAAAWSCWREAVDHVERCGRMHVPWFAVQEQLPEKWSGLGRSPIPIHFHALCIFSKPALDLALRLYWRQRFG